MRHLIALTLTVFLALTGFAAAQEAPQPDYAAWEKLAGQAEQILQSGQANDARLDAIRAEVVKWRDSFRAAEGTNATRIATLRDQIAALGPPPPKGRPNPKILRRGARSWARRCRNCRPPGLPPSRPMAAPMA
ncbi:hypothetical protein [Paracoccus cavernae]|uniref:hypothetical protein n=1 Tax=Paracoccus cavernae TaxID=1571207 RepID=UPI00364362AE